MESAPGGSNRAGKEGTTDVLPASLYLQEKLQERRSRNTRPKRARQSDFGPRNGRDDDIFLNEAEESKHAANRGFDSSPLAPVSRAGLEGSGNNARKRGLGVKDLGEQMDRLTKQNFDLKLELDHRRQHTAKLQEQIEMMHEQVGWAEQMKEEHAELLRINSQLVDELEKRDKAVEEAMDLICELEDKVADLEERNSSTRPSTAHADSGYAETETHEQIPPSSPPEPSKAPKTPHLNRRQPPLAASAAAGKLTNAADGQTPARPRREPFALSQKKPSTHALRSVYLETAQSLHPVQSFNSLLTRRESKIDEDEPVLDSPRLSVLSESSFPSIYSPKKNVSPNRFTWEAEDALPVASPSIHLRQDSIKRVSQWMDERDQTDETPSKSNRVSPPLLHPSTNDSASSLSKRPGDEARYPSIAKALSSATTARAQPSVKMGRDVSYIKPYPIRTDRKMPSSQTRPTSFAGPMFGEPDLPPTPDSASTRMLRGSHSSLSEERSLLDTTPAAVKGYDALEPDIRTSPKQSRSSMELNFAYHNYLSYSAAEHHNAAVDDDTHSEIVRDLSLDYDGFPDGESIIVGTPSRFLKHPKKSANNVTFDGIDALSRRTARSPLRRRQSSSEATVSPRKPSFGRAETSPTMIPQVGRVFTGGPKSSNDSVTSPRSFHSGSSSNRTVIQTEERSRAISPSGSGTEPRPTRSTGSHSHSQNSTSPSRTLSQRTQALFRRMSNSQRDNHSEREKSPLPTLTSTPSSAYINDVPKEARRPGTGYSGDALTQITPRPPSSEDGRRPSMPVRTSTAPGSVIRPSSASMTERAPVGRKNMFKRRNSVQKSSETPPADSTTANQDGSVTRLGMIKRRGSIRDAVGSAARRPWR